MSEITIIQCDLCKTKNIDKFTKILLGKLAKLEDEFIRWEVYHICDKCNSQTIGSLIIGSLINSIDKNFYVEQK